jgi:hypothetical protein
MRQLFLLLAISLGWFPAMAQSLTKISGKVNDDQGKQLASATVSLLRSADSSLVKVAVADKNGFYEFINIKEGNYLLQFSSVGFGKVFSNPISASGSELEIPVVTLKQHAKDMNAVTITAKKPFVETKLDRTIVNVDASPTSAGSTALEVLEKSPGIMVNTDGVISLRGKQGVIVMVDGKPTYLSPADLATLLRNMPASALETIEIMTNPSSKYDATGNSGMINIKT